MLTLGLFDIRFREQFDLLSPLKLSGRPSERQAGYRHVPSAGGGSSERQAAKGQLSSHKDDH